MQQLGQADVDHVVRRARTRQRGCQLLQLVAVSKLTLGFGAGVAIRARLVQEAARRDHEHNGRDRDQDDAENGCHCCPGRQGRQGRVRRLETERTMK